MVGVLSCGLAACGSPIPNQYLKQAESGVTLTSLTKRLAEYEGKVVILGGVIIDEKSGDNRVWLRVKNRPLDGDYVPHIPITKEGPEAGQYWVMVWNKDLPKDYQEWARVTIVGRVLSGQDGQQKGAVDEGLVLSALYLHGWDKRMGGYGMQEEDDRGRPRPPVPPRSLQKNSSSF
jgi:starvation-inducible outer membrane lipoprotein